ncbi:hypothetical protein BV392_07405 [Rhodovulum sulfidophilum]|nr:hypothetical protein BV392_07405 [Rhodovulum sulfidophilum]
MSGRAAERLVLGDISGGAGEDRESDLALATSLVLQMDRELGLGCNGDGWLGPSEMQRLTEQEKQRVRAKLGQAERKAYALLGSRKDTLVNISNDLVQRREMNASALAQWFDGTPSDVVSHTPVDTA